VKEVRSRLPSRMKAPNHLARKAVPGGADAKAENPATRIERAAPWSVAASTAITAAKGKAGLSTGSLALVSDAAHSLLDLASTTITWLAVRADHKPADAEHHYGHGKMESLAALLQTALCS
jgi:divalent metal cation (Fe/Co/Zn/Cd) transporter